MTKLYPSTATTPERARLREIADELAKLDRAEQGLREVRQALRDEQRRLNAQAYRPVPKDAATR